MDDRFVLVSTRKWSDPWYRGLERDTQRVFDYLTEYPGKTITGIFERALPDMAYEAQLEISPFEGACQRLQTDGRLLREGYCWLILKWFSHQIRRELRVSDNRFIAARNELEAFAAKCPTLCLAWVDMYAPSMEVKGLARGLQGALVKQEQYQEQEQYQKQDQEEGLLLIEPVAERDAQLFEEMRRWRGYPFERKRDLEFIAELSREYKSVDLLDVAKSVTLWLEKNPKQKGSRLRLRNFVKKQAEWDSEKLLRQPNTSRRSRLDDFDASELAR